MFSTFSNPIATAIDQGFRNGVPFLSSLPKDALWKLYLESFPETNPIYKTRQHYDCQCCRNFIKDNPTYVSVEKCADAYYEDGEFGL